MSPAFLRAHLSSNSEVQFSTSTDLCNRLSFGKAQLKFQGLSLTYNQLYLVEGDRVYTVPLTDRYIDWRKHKRVALFNREDDRIQGQGFATLGFWYQIDWIKPIIKKRTLNVDSLVLNRFMLEENVNVVEKEFLGVQIIFQYYNSTSAHLIEYFNSTDHITKSVDADPNESLISEAKDGQRNFDARYNDKQEVVIKFFEPKKPHKEVTLELIKDRPYWVRFGPIASKSPKNRPLISQLPIFGFIHNRTSVQIWDHYQRIVFVFELTDSIDFSNEHNAIELPLKRIPFNEFFICSEFEWNYVDQFPTTEEPSTSSNVSSNPNPGLPDNDKNSSFSTKDIIIFIASLIFGLVVLVGIILGIRYFRSNAANRVVFDSSTGGESNSRPAPSVELTKLLFDPKEQLNGASSL